MTTTSAVRLPRHLPVGTLVRRGKGRKLWRIDGLSGDLIVLEPVDGYTGASVLLHLAHTLTVVDPAPVPVTVPIQDSLFDQIGGW